MLKKIILFSLIIIMAFPVFDCALAEGADYGAISSSPEVYYGENVTLDIKTPLEAETVKVYMDGKYKCKATLVTSEEGLKKWTAKLTMKKLGLRKISFRAYSPQGKLIKRFPDTPVTVTVDHLLPVTQQPMILDADRVVLLGTPPQNCGTRQRGYGFYMGTDSANLSENIKSNSIIRGSMNKLVTALLPDTTYYYQSYVVISSGTIKGQVVTFTTPGKKEWTAEDANIADTADRYKFLFGTDSKFYKMNNRPFGYATKAEADTHMVTFDVPVWRLKSGKKVSSTMSLTVNYKLENSAKAIFQEIYNLDMQFPMITLKGYWYRRASGPGVTSYKMMSHHSFGSAIDINKPYNLFYTQRDKRNKKSPYYIPQEVIDIFARYGWDWGGNFKEGFDTMHFQYLGLDLIGKYPG